MKTMKKIIPALAMLLVSAVLLGTSTFAWFSMNARVTVTGMTVNTKVSSNLLISPTTTEGDFATALSQTRAGTLEPVSTVNATSFFWHNSDTVVASGHQDNNVFTGYTEAAMDAGWTTPLAVCASAGKVNMYDAAFNTNYGNAVTSESTAVYFGYIDYTFYLKAVSSSDNQKVALTTCNLLYNTAAVTDKAWRVAVLSTTGYSTAALADAASPALVSILTLTGAANQTAGKAATSTSALGDVTYGGAATIDSDIDGGNTRYYKVIVRLYLEGEDTTCNNTTYATLTSNYTLDLAFSLSETTGVTVIGSVVPTP